MANWKDPAVKILLATLAFLVTAAAAQGAEPKPPEGLSAARNALADAVVKKDVKGFAALSRFPMTIDVYQMAPTIAAKRFDDGDVNMMFGGGDEGVVGCLRGGEVVKNDPEADETAKRFGKSWYVACDGNNYFFIEKDGRWLFTGYQNVNE